MFPYVKLLVFFFFKFLYLFNRTNTINLTIEITEIHSCCFMLTKVHYKALRLKENLQKAMATEISVEKDFI